MLPLNDIFVSQVVILSLLILVTIRPLFKKIKNKDAPSLFALIAFLLAILHLVIFGFQILSIITFIVAFIVFCMNGPALYRLSQKLYTHRFTPGFCFFSYFMSFLCVVCLALQCFFVPSYIDTSNQVKTEYVGSFSQGFIEKTNIFNNTDLVITEWGEDSNQKEIGVIYLSPVNFYSYSSSKCISAIAKKNISVLTGDFYNNRVIDPFKNYYKEDTISEKKVLLKQKELELENLIDIARKKYEKVFVIVNGELNSMALEVMSQNDDFVEDVLSLDFNNIVSNYYGKNIGDFTEMTPLDSLVFYHKNWDSYKGMKSVAKKEIVHEQVAEFIEKKVSEVLK